MPTPTPQAYARVVEQEQCSKVALGQGREVHSGCRQVKGI